MRVLGVVYCSVVYFFVTESLSEPGTYVFEVWLQASKSQLVSCLHPARAWVIEVCLTCGLLLERWDSNCDCTANALNHCVISPSSVCFKVQEDVHLRVKILKSSQLTKKMGWLIFVTLNKLIEHRNLFP